MSEPMRKILYYEELLKFKDGTHSALHFSDVKNWSLCRTCLSDEDCEDYSKIYVMGVDGSLLHVKDVVVAVTEHELQHNRLPGQLCTQCVDKIAKLYYFKIQIKRAEDVLQRLLNKLDEDVPKEELPDSNEISSSTPDENIIIPDPVSNIQVGIQDSHNESVLITNTSDESFEINEQEIEPEEMPEEYNVDSDIEGYSATEVEIIDLNEDNEKTFEAGDDEIMLHLEISKVFLPSEAQEYSTHCFLQSQLNVTDKDVDSTDSGLDPKLNSSLSSATRPQSGKRKPSAHPLLENLACTVCQKSFSLQSDLILHVQREHPKVKAFKCRECDIMFAHVQSLSRHYRRHQSVQKRIVCDYCGKAFLRHDDWKRHVRVHTGERPYLCALCDKSFKQQSELKEHHVTHVREKKFVCKICDHRLISRNGLYLHLKGHKGLKNFICTQCEKRFLTNGQLKSHLKVHRSKK